MDGAEQARSITDTLKALYDHQGARLAQHLISARLYGNQALVGANGVSIDRLSTLQPGVRDRIAYNVIQSAVDTVVAKMGKNKPRPLFLTSGGDYKLQRKAKKLNKFIDGVFYENKAHALGEQCLRDACVRGDGIVHVFAENKRVKFERVNASELYVDDLEALYGQPRQMHRVKDVDRLQLEALIPEAKSKIAQANPADDKARKVTVSDMVRVRESWHLPSGPEAGDGRHVISLDGAVLCSEEWELDFFPFAVMPWSKRLMGFWGQGLAEQLQNIQLEINKLLFTIQRSFELGASFKILVEKSSKIASEKFDNRIGTIIPYTGTPPQYITPPMVPPEVFAHLETLKRQAFEQAGISQLSAAAKKPEGLDSGKALREYNDIESDRFMTVGHQYEQFFLDLGKLAIATVKQIAESEGNYTVKVPSKRFLETIDWKDVELEEDEYVMQCFPVSSLPNEPAGRMQTVQEWVQAGWLTPRQGKRLMDFPDLEMAEGLQNAAEEWVTQILEKIVDEGEITNPEPYDDLQLARELALEFYAQGKAQNLEPERLELLRTFMAQIDMLEQAAMPPPMPGAMPGMPAMPGGPQAAAMAPPQSDLIPNAPGVLQ